MQSPGTAGQTTFSRGYRAWLLGILALVNALTLADRQAIAVSVQAIKRDLKFTDAEIGLAFGLGFAILYTLLGLPLARMAERMSRTRIVAGSLAIFGVMTALCGMAQGFWSFLVCRVGVGIGDAGFGPPVASLIGDHYPTPRRASAMSIIWLGAPVGVVGGSYYGGWMAEHLSWRLTFASIGAAGAAVAVLAILSLREPARGACDPPGTMSVHPPSAWTVLKFLLGKRSMVHIFIGCGIAAAVMNAIGQFLGPFLVRTFHVGDTEQGALLSVIAFAGMASGLALGGFGVDWAAKFDRRWYVWGPALSLALAAPAFMLGFSQRTLPATVVAQMAAHVVMFVYFTATLGIAQNMVGADMRASSAFAVALVVGLVGIGAGPLLAGILSDAFAARAFALGEYASMCPGGQALPASGAAVADACSRASTVGVRYALMSMAALLAWAGAHYLLAARSLRQDLDDRFVPIRP